MKQIVTVSHCTIFAFGKVPGHHRLVVRGFLLRFLTWWFLSWWLFPGRVFWLCVWDHLTWSRKRSSGWLTFFNHPCSTRRHHRSYFLCSLSKFTFRRRLWLTFRLAGMLNLWSWTLLASAWKRRSQLWLFNVCLSSSPFNRPEDLVPVVTITAEETSKANETDSAP